jgi:hypothetical protein
MVIFMCVFYNYGYICDICNKHHRSNPLINTVYILTIWIRLKIEKKVERVPYKRDIESSSVYSLKGLHYCSGQQ